MSVIWKAAPQPPLIDALFEELVPVAYQTISKALSQTEPLDADDLIDLQVVAREAFSKAVPTLREVNEAAEEWAAQSAARLVKGINRETRAALQRTIALGLRHGWTDDELAVAIAKKVGLGDRYATAVESYRQGLINSGVPRGDARRMAGVYADRLRTHRAVTIARTEVQSALVSAQRSLWIEGMESGEIPSYAKRKWQVHKDERTCPTCRPLHAKIVDLRTGTYTSGGVTVIGPPLHPNCRCFEELTNGAGAVIKHEIIKARSRGPSVVRTRAGEEKYNQPRGTVIVADPPKTSPAKRPAKAQPRREQPKRKRKTKAELEAERRQREQESLERREAMLNEERASNIRMVVREDDKRKLQGQTPTHFIHPLTGQPMDKTSAGDIPEAMFNMKGWQIVTKFLKVKGHGQMAGVSGQRNIPLDHVIGGEGGTQRYAAEIKSVAGADPKVSIRWESKMLKLWAIEDDRLANPRKKPMTPLIIGQHFTQNPDGSGTVRVFAYVGAYDSPYFYDTERGRSHMLEIGSYKYTANEMGKAVEQGKANGQRKRAQQSEVTKRLGPELARLKAQLKKGKNAGASKRLKKASDIYASDIVDYDMWGDPIYELDTILDFAFSPPAVYTADPLGIPHFRPGTEFGQAPPGWMSPS